MTSTSRTVLAPLAFAVLLSGAEPLSNSPNTGMADPIALIGAFDKFLKGAPTGGSHVLTMPLVALRGITNEAMNAKGQVTIDVSTGSVTSKVRGLPPNGSFTLWLIQNRPALGHTTL